MSDDENRTVVLILIIIDCPCNVAFDGLVYNLVDFIKEDLITLLLGILILLNLFIPSFEHHRIILEMWYIWLIIEVVIVVVTPTIKAVIRIFLCFLINVDRGSLLSLSVFGLLSNQMIMKASFFLVELLHKFLLLAYVFLQLLDLA